MRNFFNVDRHEIATDFRKAAAFALVLAALGAACSGQSLKDPDGDEVYTKARAFSHMGPTEDKLDPAAGDVEDWRFFQPEKAGKMEIRISVGKWKESTITGTVQVRTIVGDIVLERPIPPGNNVTIKATFDVQPNLKYLVQFKALTGRGEYAVEVGDPENPCAACSDKQECTDNKCVDKPCLGACKDNETCDKNSNKCVAAKENKNKCEGVSCAKGETCQKSTGRCVTIVVHDKPEAPKCAANQELKGGDCVEKQEDIACMIIDVREGGSGSILTLSAGDNKGVTKGMKGYLIGVKGASFVITEVYPSRSKATSTLPPAKFAGNTKAAIKR